ncbi:MAG: uroporphyrinogen-III synthase [Halieaceae bacterium]|jgi:uroporphyrinogen-III synthase|nr:uroporphyrinogen-III synthase [Halieaceae bacterium]
MTTLSDDTAAPAVLVTRPSGQADALGSQLVAAGFTPVFAPLLSIEPFPELAPEQQQLLRSLPGVQHLIFVSQNAIRCGMDWIDRMYPEPPPGLAWYTVGAASAEALSRRGVHAQTPATEMTSEGLLALPALQAVHGERVVIVKGEGGRAHLKHSLQARGAQVDDFVVYRRGCPAYAPGELEAIISAGGVEYILISSGEGLDNMVSLLEPSAVTALTECKVVVPGERVAAQAQEAGFRQIVVARNATDDAMLAALQRDRRGTTPAPGH